MPSEREIRAQQEAVLFDLILLSQTIDDNEREILFTEVIERAQSGMTAEEIDTVKQRVSRVQKVKNQHR